MDDLTKKLGDYCGICLNKPCKCKITLGVSKCQHHTDYTWVFDGNVLCKKCKECGKLFN